MPCLMQTLAAASDVRPMLERRFDMCHWFRHHGYPPTLWEAPAINRVVAAKSAASHHAAARPAAGQKQQQQPLSSSTAARSSTSKTPAPVARQQKDVLLLFDFDKTITDYDAGKWLPASLLNMLVYQTETSVRGFACVCL